MNDLYSWDIGKILQFSSDKRNGPQNKIYCDEFTNVSVLYHCYTKSDGCYTKYKLHTDTIVHEYLPMTCYLCMVHRCELKINCFTESHVSD